MIAPLCHSFFHIDFSVENVNFRLVLLSMFTSFVPERSNKKGARFAKARETVAFLLAQKSLAKNALPYSLLFVISERLLQHINGCTGIF